MKRTHRNAAGRVSIPGADLRRGEPLERHQRRLPLLLPGAAAADGDGRAVREQAVGVVAQAPAQGYLEALQVEVPLGVAQRATLRGGADSER